MCWVPFLTLRILVERRAVLIAENLVLRQQLAVLRRSVKRPRVKPRDRIFWALMSRLWSGWRSALIIVKPATVVRWHRQGFRLYGDGRAAGIPGVPRSHAKSETSSAGCPKPTRCGGRPGSTANFSRSESTSRRPPWPSTWSEFANHRHQPGALSSIITSAISCRPTSSRSPPRRSAL